MFYETVFVICYAGALGSNVRDMRMFYETVGLFFMQGLPAAMSGT